MTSDITNKHTNSSPRETFDATNARDNAYISTFSIHANARAHTADAPRAWAGRRARDASDPTPPTPPFPTLSSAPCAPGARNAPKSRARRISNASRSPSAAHSRSIAARACANDTVGASSGASSGGDVERRWRRRDDALGDGDGDEDGDGEDARAVSSPCKWWRFDMMASMATRGARRRVRSA